MEGATWRPRHDRWARDHAVCQRCGSDRRPHQARGYCGPCYGQLYRAGALPGTRREREDRDWHEELTQDLAADDAYLVSLQAT
jgi:hypothetical protein